MKNFKKIASISILFLFINGNIYSKTVYYVKVDGTGTGTSWANAAGNIQTMIDKAISGDEVWVSKGTYYPSTETIARDIRSRSFVLKNGVNLYGGFAGTESTLSQRLLADLNSDGKVDSCELVNKTILSGDIDGIADVWIKTINADGKTWKWIVTGNEGNCYNVVTGGTLQIIFNGFTVIGGNANNAAIANQNKAGGIYSSATVSNCIVSNCSTDFRGGGIYSTYSTVSNCNVSNCSAGYGGGIYSYSSSVTNCIVTNCSASISGGGIYSYSSYDYYNNFYNSYVTNCIVSNCTASSGGGIYYDTNSNYSKCYVNNCIVSNCSSGLRGGGIYSSTSTTVTYCTISNSSAGISGGGIYFNNGSSIINSTVSNCSADSGSGGGICSLYSSVTNCTVSNCSAGKGGGIYSDCASVVNSAISNCSASGSAGGIYSSSSYSSFVTNCASSNNNTTGTIGSGIVGSTSGCISPSISDAYIQSTSFIGTAITDAQKTELLNANWRLKEGSPCINSGTNDGIYLTLDIDNNPRVLYGIIDIGAYEYIMPKISIPVSEDFNNWTDFEKSEIFYRSSNLNTLNDIKWTIVNQKADFNWQTNLTYYSQPFFTYQIDATKTSKVYLQYDMFFQAYAGTISPLGTEKLDVEFSTGLVTWTTIASYSNLNGTIPNKNYKIDISSLADGNTFFIRFNANGVNSNRIEKWEIDNIIIDSDVINSVNDSDVINSVNSIPKYKYNYSINNGDLIISDLELGAGIQLYDINGRLLNTKKAESQITRFALPVRGVYLVKVSSVSGVVNKKMVW
jgi:hypothetical protein